MAFQVSRFSEFAEMFAQAEQNANDLANARDIIDALRNDAHVNAEKIEQQHSRITTLEHDLAEVARERDTFRSQYRDADALVNTLRGDLDAAQSLLSESRDEVTKLGDLVASLEARLSKAEAKNHDLGEDNVELVATIDRIYDAIKATPGWVNPDAPIPAPEVASLPPTIGEHIPSTWPPISASQPEVNYPLESPSPSEAQKEPQLDGETASPEHGSSDPKGGDWRSIF